MVTELNRYKVNAEAQAILVRHAVDLGKLSFSFTGQTLYLSGNLLRQPAASFTPDEIRSLDDELRRHPAIRNIQYELDNWVITQEYGVFAATPREELEERRR
jgi:hypothetical protein